jgi:putative membrane protein
MSETQLRDEMAVERTHLANERTLLAYIRTALALAGGGAAMLQFLPDIPSLFIVAWLLILGGMATAILGTARFIVVRRRLNVK